MRLTRTIATAAAVAGLSASAAVIAPAANAGTAVRSFTVTITATELTTNLPSSTLHAGRYIINVRAVGDEHDLQLLKLPAGVTLAQAGAKLDAAFNGSVSAVRWVDRNLRFYGGATAFPGVPGQMAETLYAGKYVLLDSNGNAHSTLTVVGTPPANSAWIPTVATLEGNIKDHFVAPATIPHSGWLLFKDTSDEPHMMDMQQVVKGTTVKQVLDFLRSGNQGNPSFALDNGVSAGTVSGGTSQLLHYSLPAGQYVMLCFWPSDENGMPHALMGMVRMVNVA